MIYFIFCVHNHQPVGNFDHVLEYACDRAYEPLLRKLSERPSFKFCFHTSGFLLDWLALRRPGYIELLKSMVNRGQVELMGGGYYEPILSIIPHRDRSGQIKMMNDRIEELFGVRPKGIWLAERVWDPTLPYYLNEAGVEYVVVDDYHFVKSGFKKEALYGYYITEDLGRPVRVFPGGERLRYLIPFEPVEKLEEYLREIDRAGKAGGVGIFADDGEKFGIWPGTDRSVYEEGWIDRFLETIEGNSGWVKTISFSDYMEKEKPMGRAYLTTTAYMEMGEWALFAEASGDYAALREEVKSWGNGERVLRFFQGGTWRNFLAKYPEADWMHKRMLDVSETVERNRSKDVYPAARRHLYMAQCNDAYWHGVFGGLYLPHLRAHVYENLIKAEGLISPSEGGEASVRVSDIDGDTYEEVVVKTEDLGLFFSPAKGGSLVEIDWRAGAANLSNTLSRWHEGYHMRLKKAGCEKEGGGRSIHGSLVVKEEGLERYLRFDSVQRTSLRERFLKEDETCERLSSGEDVELGDFFNGLYTAEVLGNRLLLSREGTVKGTIAVKVSKGVKVESQDSFSVAYRLEGPKEGGGFRALFGVEFNLCLPGCNGPDCYYEFGGLKESRTGMGGKGEISGVLNMRLVDGFSGVGVSFNFDRGVTVWRYPVETVSLSEAGFEKNYQGSSLVFLLPGDFPFKDPGVLSFSVKIEPLGEEM